MSSSKIRSAADAVALVQARDSVGFPLGPGQPAAFLHALGERDSYEDLQLSGALLIDLYAVFTKPGVHYRSGFFGPAERILRDAGADIEFIPADFRRFGPLLQTLSPRVMTTIVTPPDAEGWMSLGLHAGATVAELHRAGADPERILLVETNPNLPRTMGLPPEHRHAIHVDEVDVIVESDRDVFVLAEPEPTEVDRAIAAHAAEFIVDGSTLQTGIGGVPSMVARLLAEGPGGNYGIHSEMFTTGLMQLHEAGKVANRKGIYDGISVTTFAAGTPELNRWLDGRESVRFLPVELINAPEAIDRNAKMVTINGALTIDLAGQIVADTVGSRQFSGVGGHEDFVSAPGLELDDRSLVCTPSTATVGGVSVSRIVGELPAGAIVTTPRHQIDIVITEWGAAELRGKTVRERARLLAGIAHPDHRAELLDAAERVPQG